MAERTNSGPIVIVGGGMAGGNAAVTLRQEGYRGPAHSHQPGTGRPVWPASALQDVPAVGGTISTTGTSGPPAGTKSTTSSAPARRVP